MNKVIITGCHRSGTSLVTGLLQICGLYLGDNLIMGLSDNPKGHFEDKEFVQINDAILAYNKGSWDKPPKTLDINTHLRVVMVGFLSKWSDEKLCGFKDPRACITLPLWRRLIDDKLKVVYCERLNEAIAKSLQKRNGGDLEKWGQLAQTYKDLHINGIKDDNRIENLQLYKNKASHSKHEKKLNHPPIDKKTGKFLKK